MEKLINKDLFKTACYVNGNWIEAANGDSIDVQNPFNQQLLGTVPSLSQQQVEQSIADAQTAQKDWAKKTAQHRADILHKWADLIDSNVEDLAIIMTLEQGKPLAESRGEIAYANSYIRWFAEEGKRLYGDTIPAKHPDHRYTILKQPIGVCAAITPWNFPAAMITRKVAPALAVGCTIIVKPASETPYSALALARLAEQAGMPAGVLQVVTGKASVIGKLLTQDDRIRKLSFTGSTEIGRLLMSQSANTIKKLSLELGGNAPFIVFADANLEDAANGLIACKFRNAGQTCVCANRIYLHTSIKDEFLAIFKQKMSKLTIGNGLDDGVMIGPLINKTAVNSVQSMLQEAISKGASLLAGGDVHPSFPLCFRPTIITDITPDMSIYHDEIFAPVVAVYEFATTEEVIDLANDTPYGLAAYFYTNDMSHSWQVSEALEYGMVAQNTGMLSSEVAPFGGIKQSGFGREGSKYGIDEYVVSKYWCQQIKTP